MKKKLIIEGMTCENCAKHVTEALEEIPGVKEVNVDLDSMSAEVELNYDIDDEEFKFVLDDMGYELVEVEELWNIFNFFKYFFNKKYWQKTKNSVF